MNGPGIWTTFATVLRRDLVLAYRHRAEVANPLVFFLIVTSLFPLAVTPEPGVLGRIAPGVIWVSALLATLLSLDSVFRSDYEDGTLEQMLAGPAPLGVVTLAKALAHWLVTGLPLIVTAPLLAVLMALPDAARPMLLATLCLGTPSLSLIGTVGVALTVGLRRTGALLSLLVLPLYIPVLVFGSLAVIKAAAGLPAPGELYWLGAILALAASLAPAAAAAALRISLD